LHTKTLEQEEQARKNGNKRQQHEIHRADFHEWAPAYDEPPFGFLHIDFPHGIGQDSFNQKSRTTETYLDTPENFWALFDTLESNFNRLVAENAGAVFWSSNKFPLSNQVFDASFAIGLVG
jgi:hypothetical protein